MLQISRTYMQILDILDLANMADANGSHEVNSEHGFSRVQKRSDSDLMSIVGGIQLHIPEPN